MSQNNQERIQQIWVEITQWEKQKESGVSLATQAQIDNDIASARTEIDRLEAEDKATEKQAIQQEHDTRVDGTVRAVDTDLETIDFGGLTIRQLIPNQDDYLLVSIGIKQYIQSLADKFSLQISGLQAASNDQKRSFDEREIQLQRQNDSLQQKLNQRDLDYKDLETRFTAATNELVESNQEKDSLKVQVTALQKSPQESTKTVEELEVENRQKEEAAARIRKERTIYNRRWLDEIKQNTYVAYLAATGEEIQFPWTEATKYFVIAESEVSQFREQYAIAITPEVSIVAEEPVQASIAEGVQFQTVTAPIVGPIQIPGQPVNSGVETETAEEPVTREWVKEYVKVSVAQAIADIRGEQVT